MLKLVNIADKHLLVWNAAHFAVVITCKIGAVVYFVNVEVVVVIADAVQPCVVLLAEIGSKDGLRQRNGFKLFLLVAVAAKRYNSRCLVRRVDVNG